MVPWEKTCPRQASHPANLSSRPTVYLREPGYCRKSDWRLPNARELHGIPDYSRSPDTTNSAAINPLFNISEIKDEGNNRDFPFFWSSTTHLDGRNPGEWAVYISFGEAEGFMGGGMNEKKQRGPRPKRRRN